MDYTEIFGIHKGLAVCSSGYRHGQRPGHLYPTYNQVTEDLIIIEKQCQYIRLYSCDAHSITVLEVIKDQNMTLKVMLGAYIEAEENNANCPWGGSYDLDQLSKNKKSNLHQMDALIYLANTYPDIIFSLSVGNEACVDWTDHLVSVAAVISYVRYVKAGAKQPVTFCENYVPWLDKLEPLAHEVDFISIHNYTVWEYKTIDEGIE